MVQAHDVGEPELKSVKETLLPTFTVVGVPEKFAIGAEGEEHGLEEPFKTSKPVFPGSRYVFNLSLFGVPLLVQ